MSVSHTAHAVPYGLGKLMDVYLPARPGPSPVVLLWHGVGPDERDVLAALAATTARLGVVVTVPDWRSTQPDRGRAQLFASLDFVRDRAAALGGDPGSITLAGWSLGGRAAAGIAVNPAVTPGWRPSAVVCLGSGFAAAPAPTTGTPPLTDLQHTGADPIPCWLVHGTRDSIAGIGESRGFAAALISRGWPVRLAEPDTDHAGVVMAEYDPGLQRCRPVYAGSAAAAGHLSARVLATAASGADPTRHSP